MDALSVLCIPDFIRVNERVVLSNFTHHVGGIIVIGLQECFIQLEEFLLDLLGHADVVVVLVCNQQVLFNNCRRAWKTDEVEYDSQTLVNLFLEVAHVIRNNAEVRMADPSVD